MKIRSMNGILAVSLLVLATCSHQLGGEVTETNKYPFLSEAANAKATILTADFELLKTTTQVFQNSSAFGSRIRFLSAEWGMAETCLVIHATLEFHFAANSALDSIAEMASIVYSEKLLGFRLDKSPISTSQANNQLTTLLKDHRSFFVELAGKIQSEFHNVATICGCPTGRILLFLDVVGEPDAKADLLLQTRLYGDEFQFLVGADAR